MVQFSLELGATRNTNWSNLQRGLYNFRTDVSNPLPTSGTTYSPSLVMQDFAAACGQTYTVNLLARDTGDAGFLNACQAEDIICPAATFTLFLPAVLH